MSRRYRHRYYISLATTSLARRSILLFVLYTLSMTGGARALCSGSCRRRPDRSGNGLLVEFQSAGERRFLARCDRLDVSQHLLQSRCRHGGAQRRRQPGVAQSLDLQPGSGRLEFAQSCQRTGVHNQRPDQDRRFSKLEGYGRSDVQSVRLCPLAHLERHQRLDLHDHQHVTVPAGIKTRVPPADLRLSDAVRERMVCKHVDAAGDTAGAASVHAVPELPRLDVFRSKSGRKHGPDRGATDGNLAEQPSGRNRRGRRGRHYGGQPDLRCRIERVHSDPRHGVIAVGDLPGCGKTRRRLRQRAANAEPLRHREARRIGAFRA